MTDRSIPASKKRLTEAKKKGDLPQYQGLYSIILLLFSLVSLFAFKKYFWLRLELLLEFSLLYFSETIVTQAGSLGIMIVLFMITVMTASHSIHKSLIGGLVFSAKGFGVQRFYSSLNNYLLNIKRSLLKLTICLLLAALLLLKVDPLIYLYLVLGTYFVFTLFELYLERSKFLKSYAMTPQEHKEEIKSNEGAQETKQNMRHNFQRSASELEELVKKSKFIVISRGS